MPFFVYSVMSAPRRCLREALMRKRSISSPAVVANIALMTGVLITNAAVAQMDHGPKTEKTFGVGLPRDHASQLFADKDYPVFPLKPGQEAYKSTERLAPAKLGRQLQYSQRHQGRSRHRIPRIGHQGHGLQRSHCRSDMGWHRRRTRFSWPRRQGQGRHHLQHLRSRWPEPFGFRSRRIVQCERPGAGTRRRHGHQRYGSPRQRPIPARGRSQEHPADDHQSGRGLRPARPARRR